MKSGELYSGPIRKFQTPSGVPPPPQRPPPMNEGSARPQLWTKEMSRWSTPDRMTSCPDAEVAASIPATMQPVTPKVFLHRPARRSKFVFMG